ncbi:MFS transporter [Bradyrhizobium sp. 17]|uniref:MFS transporter n=1 Tax=Bradyrhizobium sp. 17 TaxID=2782649 RepID=UPI001FF98E1B|nr:MFS transporter [Bradyrhizobium sp. 17]MCK1525255.1 MHS family MFS transporter [Bradyrhizobium sp. 17]
MTVYEHASTTTAAKPTSKGWVVAATVVGTTIEWYDFFIFGTASALVFSKLFFPSIDPVSGTLASFATFAVGLFARPLGGLVFGHFGDRIGRKSMLLLSLFLMGIPTVLIGLLPTYSQIGIWAAVLLVLLRICQGIAVGGEWGGAVLMAVEHADGNKRSLFGSLPQAGTPAGLILATLVFAHMSSFSESDFLAWGWRVPFLASIVLILLGSFVRSKVPESPVFLQAKNEGQTVAMPSAEVVSTHLRPLLLAVGAKLAEVTLFYLVTIFILQYSTVTLGLSRAEVLNSILIAATVGLFAIPIYGHFGDKIGARTIYGVGGILLALFAIPLFLMVNTKDPLLIRLGIVVSLGLIYPTMFGLQPALYSAQFPPGVRYSGMSLGVQIAAAIGGGLAPIIATTLLTTTGSTLAIGFYLGGLALVAAACAFSMKPSK